MIEIEGICKSYKVGKRTKGIKGLFQRDYQRIDALKDLSLKVSPGEIVGYIGPNGAGKSTTIKIMSGIIVPDKGKCQINGVVPWKSRIAHVRNIGVVFGQRTQLWWDVPVIDSYNLLKDIYKIDPISYKNTLEELVEALDIRDLLITPVRLLSLGQKMKCEIVAALLHSPKLLFLDEPTIGLDAVSKVAVRAFIRKLNTAHNTTVILTTHDMNDIETLASRIVLIGKGSKLYDGDLQSLKDKYLTHKLITIDFRDSNEDISLIGCKLIKREKGRASLLVDLSKTTVANAVTHLVSTLRVLDISIDSQPIEEIITNMYREYSL